MKIHPTAVISEQAELHESVEVGPYAIINGRVQIDEGTRILPHAIIGSDHGVLKIGKRNIFYSCAAVGGPPQDLKYNNDPTELVIGDDNLFREFTTINIGTVTGGGRTLIGNKCMFMAYVHVAHDCHIGNNVIVANSSNFAGHVTVEDNVRIGGICQFNQFVKVGRYSYIAGDSAVNKDIIPYSMAQGKYAVARATNKIGLERAGFSSEDVQAIHRSIRTLVMGNPTIEEALAEIEKSFGNIEAVKVLTDFVKSSERGIAR
ncbi:MAG: acyl-ACP--UDP-N-acetylglucosamine O-acyltransferase [Bdellovibrionales bacterium]|nr:acyl-ACP--UDP-N-acetylglucosamine O-acyltransferase [Bdellovibrionales bacterium]